MNTLNLKSEKATMVLINTMGFPIVRQIKVTKSVIDDQRKYGNLTGLEYGDISLVIHYVEKGKRKPYGTRFRKSAGAQIAIYCGWHEVTTPNEFTCFSNSAYDSLKAQISAAPIFEINVKNSI